MYRMRGADRKLHLVTFKTPSLDYRLPVQLDPGEVERLGRALETAQRLGHISRWEISPAGPMDLPNLMDFLEREGFFNADGERSAGTPPDGDGDGDGDGPGFLPPSDWTPGSW
jgi:hypothetical protein